jgi:hypothetical protein
MQAPARSSLNDSYFVALVIFPLPKDGKPVIKGMNIRGYRGD